MELTDKDITDYFYPEYNRNYREKKTGYKVGVFRFRGLLPLPLGIKMESSKRLSPIGEYITFRLHDFMGGGVINSGDYIIKYEGGIPFVVSPQVFSTDYELIPQEG